MNPMPKALPLRYKWRPLTCGCVLGRPNFASLKISLRSETKWNSNGFAWFRFGFAKFCNKSFASFRVVSLRKFRFASETVSLQKFRFILLNMCLTSKVSLQTIVQCTYTVRNEGDTLHTLSEMSCTCTVKSEEYIVCMVHCQNWGIYHTYTVRNEKIPTVRNEEYSVHTLSERGNIMYYTVSIVHCIPLFDSVCTLIRYFPLSYSVCTYGIYSSFLTVYVQHCMYIVQCTLYSSFLTLCMYCTYGRFLILDTVCMVDSSFLTVYVHYIPHFWRCMYGIFLISDSVCTVYSSFLTGYVNCTTYTSFPTVYVQCIPHFPLYMYCTVYSSFVTKSKLLVI